MSESGSGTPAAAATATQRFTIKVQGPNGPRIYCTMRKTDKLHALFDRYYDSVPTVDPGTGRFFFGGLQLQGWNTPADFNIGDRDEVDFFPMSTSGAPATQRVKEEAEDDEERRISITVQDTARFRIVYKMRKTAKLQALMDFFYDSVPTVDPNTGRFFLDGQRIQGWQTPEDLNMQDGDEVDFFTELLGAGGRKDRMRVLPVAS